MSSWQSIAVRAAELPGLQVVGRPLYRRYFRRPYQGGNAYYGMFESYSQALAAAPESMPNTYDVDAAAKMYRGQLRRVRSCDYPAMYWLSRLLGEGVRDVFDLGGHMGQAYYGFREYIDYPADISWRVHDVPAVMDAGRQWAREHDPLERLGFADHPKDADGCDLLITTGALQYLEYSLPELLQGLAHAPADVLVNLVPMHLQQGYFTLQNLGIAICPYRVMCLPEFVDEMAALGYDMVDQWELVERHIRIPFEPTAAIDSYHGMYFRKSR